jgi:hypothetical protein
MMLRGERDRWASLQSALCPAGAVRSSVLTITAKRPGRLGLNPMLKIGAAFDVLYCVVVPVLRFAA